MPALAPSVSPYLDQIEQAGGGVAADVGLAPVPQQPQITVPTAPAYDPSQMGSNFEEANPDGVGDWRNSFGSQFGLKLTSGDRDPVHNKAVNGVANSYHLKAGWAADFSGTAEQMSKAAAYAHTRGAKEVLIHNAGSGQHLHVVFDPSAYGGKRLTTVAPTGQGKFTPQQLGLTPAESWILQRESGFNTYAKNPKSSAFGLGQLILSNRKKYLGSDYATTDARKQLQAFRMYVHDRYGTADNAVKFWQTKGWY